MYYYYSMACIRRVSRIINCGFARAWIYENSNPDRTGPHARQTIDISKRASNFRGQFSTYSFPDDYFEVRGKDKTTQFDRDCTKILDSFKLKFLAGGRGDRKKYLDTFSIAKWHQLPVVERKEHTLSNCIRCFEKHYDSQRSFPLKPMFTHKPLVAVDQDALQRQGVKKFTSNVLGHMNLKLVHHLLMLWLQPGLPAYKRSQLLKKGGRN